MSSSSRVAVREYFDPRLGPVAESFARWLQGVIDNNYGGVAGRLAESINVTLTTLSRGMDQGTLGADTLLRLSRVTGRDASSVLRLAGKADWAALIESCYGTPRETSPLVREFEAAVSGEEDRLERIARRAISDLQEVRALLPPRSNGANALPDGVAEDSGKRPTRLPRAR
jgi:hypothetical protein